MTLEPLAGLRVVDLYAGSGALGIEALSRGAFHVDFVESSPIARRTLHANLESLGVVASATIWPLSLPQGLRRLKGAIESADLVLMDPPYGGEEARATLTALTRGATLKPDARVVIEHHAKDGLPEFEGTLRLSRVRRYGETLVSLYLADAGEDPHNLEEDA